MFYAVTVKSNVFEMLSGSADCVVLLKPVHYFSQSCISASILDTEVISAE